MSRTNSKILGHKIELKPKHIACFGEIVWDDFPDGRRPGGSPGNFSYHCKNLGNQTTFISRVGTDTAGDELVDFLASKGISIDSIQRDKVYPSGKVLVHGPPDAPYYTIVEDSAWDFMEVNPEVMKKLPTLDAFCFATLIQRSETSATNLSILLGNLPPKVLRVLDINLRPPFFSASVIEHSIHHCDLLKLNEEELDLVSKLLLKNDLVNWLLKETKTRMVCVTKGSKGAELITSEGRWQQDAFVNPESNGDTVGVGDAFLAALTSALLSEIDPQTALNFSSRYAAKVADHKGAMPNLEWP